MTDPTNEQPSWDGTVVSATGDRADAAAAALANRTGRPHLRLADLAEVFALDARGPLTVVASPEAVGDRWLARASQRDHIGLLTARGPRRLAALVERTVSAPTWLGERSVLIDATADRPAATREEVRRAADGGGTLVLKAHGRECLVHLADGVICGRTADEPLVRPDGRRPLGLTSCVQGEGCYRLHYGDAELLPAASLGAGIVFIDSCLVQKVGDTQFTSDTTLAPTLLEGGAVAVVASPWLRGGHYAAGPQFAALLRDGLSLGAAVAAVNRGVADCERAYGRFVLLGDPGLVPYPGRRLPAGRIGEPLDLAAGGVRIAPGADPGRITVRGPADALRQPDGGILLVARGEPGEVRVEPASDRPAERFAVLADRTAAAGRLWTCGFTGERFRPDAARTELAEVWAELADALGSERAVRGLDRGRDLLDGIDRAVAEQLTSLTAQGRYHFMDSYSDASRVLAQEPESCPECGSEGLRLHWRHALDPDAERTLLSCPVCGEVVDADRRAAVSCRLEGPRHTVRGEHLVQRAVLANRTSRPVVAHLGYALLHEDLYGTEWATTLTVPLAPAEERSVDVGGPVPPHFDVADRHGLRLFAVAEGRISTYSRYLWVAAGPRGGDAHDDNGKERA
ncbi:MULTISPECIES: TFIIB-type zinc ribbon-containing protein [Kitasatospora]|uniref:Uncharacterized protein n=1 Tax=Kitasatospora setae (strain ATCC 33774 / DSM 43861 / JCM 3304 / KCC A-0304 / NBRC 14216 / KM-6054) TaxID=452652 RepID=E4ND66_KITSK|nr:MULTISPECIES: TFIIB-type zinc ribbon-containing protein [Kitasatospora]BAJ29147.1 hypothetical protein KSE_33370 [Kitasatospora setae KM-6054]